MLKFKIRMAILGVVASLLGAIMCLVAAILYASIGNNSVAFALGIKGVLMALVFVWLALILHSLIKIKNENEEEK